MNNFLFRSMQVAVLFLAFTGCSEKAGLTGAPSANPSNPLIQHFADSSFQENRLGARFIPVLDKAEDVKMGARFDTLTGRFVGASPCVAEFKEGDNGNQGSNMRLVQVSDNFSQMKTLDVDVSVQGNYLGASGNAKASFANSQQFTQQTQKFLLYAKAERKPRTIEPTQSTLFGLTGEAQAVLNDRQAFRDLCGDSFVVAIFEGIEMFGTVEYHNLSTRDQQTISGEMGVSYGGWKASASAKKAVEAAADNSNLTVTAELAGMCGDINLAGEPKDIWNNMIGAAGKLATCAETGANITSYKVVPYSKAFIRDWPYDDYNDPNIEKVLFYHDGYGAVLDSINTLLTNRDSAYQVALLDRGVSLKSLDELATTVRAKRKELKTLLSTCQSSANPSNRATGCQSENQLQGAVDEFVHPYVYRAQLPIYFVDAKPVEAFWSNDEVKAAIIRDNVQYPRDVACTFSDKASLDNYSGCPDNFGEIKSAAERAVHVANYPWPRDDHYMFQTQSTSNDYCMVAPEPKTRIRANTCNHSQPAKSRQRFSWLATGQLRYRMGGNSGQCVSEGGDKKGGSAACDSVKPEQLWRFVPSQMKPEIGLLQNAAGKCLVHSAVDSLVRYGGCYSGEDERNYQWKPTAVK